MLGSRPRGISASLDRLAIELAAKLELRVQTSLKLTSEYFQFNYLIIKIKATSSILNYKSF